MRRKPYRREGVLQQTTAQGGVRVYLTRTAQAGLRKLDVARAAALRAAFARVGQDLLDSAVNVEVDPSWARRTWPRRRYPQQCYRRTVKYLADHPHIPEAGLVHGVASHAPGRLPFDHAWVELPGNVVFDGVVQAFFTRDSYYAVMAAMPLDAYPRARADQLLRQHGHPGPWNVKWVPTPAHIEAYRASVGQTRRPHGDS